MATCNRSAHSWAARSAIQKAIRRGDIAMARQAMRILLNEEPTWLFWRMQAIVPEEVWQLSGKNLSEVELARKRYREGDVDEAVGILDRHISRVCASEKDRSANGLAMFFIDRWAMDRYDGPDSRDELHATQWMLMKTAKWMKNKKHAKEWFARVKNESSKFGDDVYSIIDACEARFFAGGMDGDKIMLMAASILAMTQETTPPPLAQIPQAPEVRAGPWPWYVYDMHTYPGKRAMCRVISEVSWKRPKFHFERVWFALESGRVNALAKTDFWWREYLRVFLKEFRVTRDVWEAPGGLRDRLKFRIESAIANGS